MKYGKCFFQGHMLWSSRSWDLNTSRSDSRCHTLALLTCCHSILGKEVKGCIPLPTLQRESDMVGSKGAGVWKSQASKSDLIIYWEWSWVSHANRYRLSERDSVMQNKLYSNLTGLLQKLRNSPSCGVLQKC